ncbi:hypothetical protein PPN31114_02827 [Pandoraea pneumonica]|uniref:Uncharacterized protein n=1 Tax=Pandoraea pneumonica TaxID=2508299 RepID=A0A5E4VQM6_9BURK|nr:hypothetical protein PPN31114_02827 [Pandoraea pneumonica]
MLMRDIVAQTTIANFVVFASGSNHLTSPLSLLRTHGAAPPRPPFGYGCRSAPRTDVRGPSPARWYLAEICRVTEFIVDRTLRKQGILGHYGVNLFSLPRRNARKYKACCYGVSCFTSEGRVTALADQYHCAKLAKISCAFKSTGVSTIFPSSATAAPPLASVAAITRLAHTTSSSRHAKAACTAAICFG